MATGKIGNRTVAALTKGPRDQFLWDTDLAGFGVKVTPAGAIIYLVQYRMGGRGARTQRYTIGPHGDAWTPTLARDEAGRLLRLVAQGTNPRHEKVERERKARDLGFNAVADRFLTEYVRPRWRASYDFAEGNLRLHIRPVFKNKPVPDLRKSDFRAVLAKIPPERLALRRNVYAVMRRFVRWSMADEIISDDPLAGFDAPAAPDSRDRWLTADELRLFWLASGDIGPAFGPMYRLLCLTGARREEVAALDWKEVDRKEREWHLPAARAKNGKPHRVHLTDLAIAELDVMAGGDKWPRKGLVFTTNGKTSVSGYSRAKRRLDAAMIAIAHKEDGEAGSDAAAFELQPWRTHDLRRTMATHLQRLGVRLEAIETALSHISGSRAGIVGVYQRHDWQHEAQAAVERWAEFIQRTVDQRGDDNVIPFVAAGAVNG